MNQALRECIFAGGQRLQLVQGDITQEEVEAIVNAANSQLQHGAGVAGAIRRRGGAKIQVESDAWVRDHGPVNHAEPAYTSAGDLPCHYVIHAVGPVWGEGDEDAKLSAAITGSLRVADQLSISSLAFPAISTGIFGFPKERAARIMLDAIERYFAEIVASRIEQVRITLFDQSTVQAFLTVWEERGGQIESKEKD